MPGTEDGSAQKGTFFGAPVSWVGWASFVLEILSFAAILNRRLTGGFRGVFAGWVLAGVVALVAVLLKKERSALVWLPLVIGALAAVWSTAEILLPH